MTTNSLKSASVAAMAVGASVIAGATSANAFTIGGNVDFDFSAPPPVVTADFSHSSVVGVNPDFSPVGTSVTVASLPLTLIGLDGVNPAIASFISGFEYKNQSAVFDLFAGSDTIVNARNGNIAATDFTFDGLIKSLGGDTLATVTGTLTGSETPTNNDFSINLAATPVPTPALLPGLLGMGMGIVRKRKQQSEASA